jgi:hypothetical protein
MRNAIERAARAHSSLSAFATIVRVLEGGLYGYHAEEEMIIRLANAAQQRLLREYDAAVAEACAAPEPKKPARVVKRKVPGGEQG